MIICFDYSNENPNYRFSSLFSFLLIKEQNNVL